MRVDWRENCGMPSVASNQNRRKQELSSRRRQRGAVLLLLALLLVITGSWLGLRMLATPKAVASMRGADAVLREARDALLGASMAMVVANVVRPGQLPTPDFLDPAEGPANYDGSFNACALSTWVAGAALPAMGAVLPASTRCLGRLPWATLGLGIFGSSVESDPAGAVPWYAISTNLAPGTCVRALNPALLNTVHTPGTCGSLTVTQPFPWLTVRDYKGNLLTNRAAFVLVLPGPPLGGQARPASPLAGPAAYLDSVTVTASCSQPCVPGTYNNARFNWPDNVGLSFIQCAPPSQVSPNDPSFTQPYQCNDRLLYVTIDELMELTERRATQHIADLLRAYYAANRFFPFAAPLTQLTLTPRLRGQCETGNLIGLPPTVPTTPASVPPNPSPCTHPEFSAQVQGWFNANSWGDYMIYNFAADCTQPTPALTPTANCGGVSGIRLASGAVAGARALLIGAGPAIITAPFAASRPGVAQERPSSLLADYLDSVENINADIRFDAPTAPLARNFNDKTVVVAP